jgi:hypothetical protein
VTEGDALAPWAQGLWIHLDTNCADEHPDFKAPVKLAYQNQRTVLGGRYGAVALMVPSVFVKSGRLVAALEVASLWSDGQALPDTVLETINAWYASHQKHLPKLVSPQSPSETMSDPYRWTIAVAVGIAAVGWYFYSRDSRSNRTTSDGADPSKQDAPPHPPTDPPVPEPRTGLLVFVLLANKAADLVPTDPDARPSMEPLVTALLDRYQSVGFVEHGSAAADTVSTLSPLGGDAAAGVRRVAVLKVEDPSLTLNPGQRPDRAFERRLVDAATRDLVGVQWKQADPADLVGIPLLGQF